MCVCEREADSNRTCGKLQNLSKTMSKMFLKSLQLCYDVTDAAFMLPMERYQVNFYVILEVGSNNIIGNVKL